MRADIVYEGGWFAIIVDDDGTTLFKSQKEKRAGCASRVALNYMEQQYGSPSTSKFVIDLDEW